MPARVAEPTALIAAARAAVVVVTIAALAPIVIAVSRPIAAGRSALFPAPLGGPGVTFRVPEPAAPRPVAGPVVVIVPAAARCKPAIVIAFPARAPLLVVPRTGRAG